MRNGEVGPLLLLLLPDDVDGVVVVAGAPPPPADGEGEERRLSRGKLPFVLILKMEKREKKKN